MDKACAQCEQSTNHSIKLDDSNIPLLHSFMVLRKEHFGGFIFNPYLPPETRLDHVRFGVAEMCDGTYTVGEIKKAVGSKLSHSEEYIDMLVNKTINSFNDKCAIRLQDEKLKEPMDFGFSGDAKAKSDRILSAPLFVIWEITGLCNLRCEHCLSSAGESLPNELSTEEAMRLLDYLEAMKVFNINLSGGEPLMRPDIFDIIDYASQKKFSIDLLTNGALITEKVLNRLEDSNIFNVQVSIDGIGETHDRFRGRKGTYERAIDAIKLLKDANYNISISLTVTRQNMSEIPRIIDTAIDLGIPSFKTTLFMPAGRGKSNIDKLVLTRQDVKDFTYMMIEKKKEVGNNINIGSETEYPWLVEGLDKKRLESMKLDDSSKIGCTAGSSSLYITPDGKIAPCPFLRNLTAGDVRERDIKEIWDNSPTFDIFRNITRGSLKGKCGNCEYLGIMCYGGCRAAALAHTGDLFAEDPMCWRELA
jgi:radical SAM protein with 4Fe4S-binding SPASM domain